MGRTRTVTAHRWMVARKKFRILVTYKGGDRYWLEIIPIEPRLRVLTSYVLRAWVPRQTDSSTTTSRAG